MPRNTELTFFSALRKLTQRQRQLLGRAVADVEKCLDGLDDRDKTVVVKWLFSIDGDKRDALLASLNDFIATLDGEPRPARADNPPDSGGAEGDE